MVLGRYDDAAALLRSSTHLQGSANEMAMIKSRLQQVESIQALGAAPSARVTTPATGVVDIVKAESVVDAV